MIFDETITKKSGKKSITNNLRRAKIIIQDGDQTTTLPYAIISIQDDTVTIKQGTNIATIPKTNIPEDILTILQQETKTNKKPQIQDDKKTSKTTIKGKKEEKE